MKLSIFFFSWYSNSWGEAILEVATLMCMFFLNKGRQTFHESSLDILAGVSKNSLPGNLCGWVLVDGSGGWHTHAPDAGAHVRDPGDPRWEPCWGRPPTVCLLLCPTRSLVAQPLGWGSSSTAQAPSPLCCCWTLNMFIKYTQPTESQWTGIFCILEILDFLFTIVL